jgi:hypothetical protein
VRRSARLAMLVPVGMREIRQVELRVVGHVYS